MGIQNVEENPYWFCPWKRRQKPWGEEAASYTSNREETGELSKGWAGVPWGPLPREGWSPHSSKLESPQWVVVQLGSGPWYHSTSTKPEPLFLQGLFYPQTSKKGAEWRFCGKGQKHSLAVRFKWFKVNHEHWINCVHFFQESIITDKQHDCHSISLAMSLPLNLRASE